jgi:hypothetical protein
MWSGRRPPECEQFRRPRETAEPRRLEVVVAPRALPADAGVGATPPIHAGPNGQITHLVHHLVVQPLREKYSASPPTQITFKTSAIPSHTEGRFAIVTDVGAGCGGRGSVRRAKCARTNDADPAFAKASADGYQTRRSLWRRRLRTAKSCGPDAPTLVSSWRSYPLTTVARKPGHRGEHEISR